MARQAVGSSFTWLDGVIIAFVAVLCAALFFGFFKGGGENIAVIEIEGKVYGRYRLSEYIEPEIIEINTVYGYNKVQISKEGARVIDADCPDKIDVKRGLVKAQGESIVCLPHRLVIYIEGEGGYDAVSY